MRQGRAAAGFGGEGLSRMNMHWGVGWILAAATAAQGYWWLDWHDLHETTWLRKDTHQVKSYELYTVLCYSTQAPHSHSSIGRRLR